jgi:hypothetical protein
VQAHDKTGGELFGDKILELYTHFGAADVLGPAAAAARSGAFRRFSVGDVILVSPDSRAGGGRHPLDPRGGAVEGTVVERGSSYLHVAVKAWPAGVWGRRRRGDEALLRFRVDRYFSDVPFVRMMQVPAVAAAALSEAAAEGEAEARAVPRENLGDFGEIWTSLISSQSEQSAPMRVERRCTSRSAYAPGRHSRARLWLWRRRRALPC